MEVWTLNKNCLITLYNNWVDYYNCCIDALNDITHWTHVSFETDYQLNKSWAAEAEYRRRCSDLINWKNKWHNELNLKHNKFLQFYKRVSELMFNSNDFGYLIKIDFYSFEVIREYDYSLPSNTFRVRFIGQSQWYTYNQYRRDMKFTPGKPEFIKIC
jgi:hypothetical protein